MEGMKKMFKLLAKLFKTQPGESNHRHHNLSDRILIHREELEDMKDALLELQNEVVQIHSEIADLQRNLTGSRARIEAIADGANDAIENVSRAVKDLYVASIGQKSQETNDIGNEPTKLKRRTSKNARGSRPELNDPASEQVPHE